MNNYWRKCFFIILVQFATAVFAVLIVSGVIGGGPKREYKVQVKRAADRIEEAMDQNGGNVDLSSIDFSEFDSVRNVTVFDSDEVSKYQYEVYEIGGTLYRIEYENRNSEKMPVICGCAFAVIIFLTGFMMLYIGRNIIKPFHRFRELPLELSRGNLSVPLNENKNKFFGNYLWGMNLLRENLEQSKDAELSFQKEKKTLLLSLAHDIKTPLSSVKLYSKALADDLYDTEEKKHEAYNGIQNNAVQIEKYIGQIMNTANDDFLNLTVNNGEFYFSELIQRISVYYTDKLKHLHTEFEIGEFENCLCYGDLERAVEVFQNIIENAIKYGDGEYIRISFGEEENCCLVTITNSGKQPPSEELLHLFDSFYRGSNSHGKKGNGLGLYICRKLMHMMDGDVFVDTDNNLSENGEEMMITVVIRMV